MKRRRKRASFAGRLLPCVEIIERRGVTDAVLIPEARELASILAKSVSTARKNTRRKKDFPNS
jgi:hypothetical protein